MNDTVILDQHSIGGLQPSAAANPLTLNEEKGTGVLIRFTGPERSKGFVKDIPGRSGLMPRPGPGFSGR